MVALNLHNKCLPKRFDEESETRKVHKGSLKYGQYKGYSDTPMTGAGLELTSRGKSSQPMERIVAPVSFTQVQILKLYFKLNGGP